MKAETTLKICFAIAVFFVFTGCSSVKPITRTIINDVGGNDEIEKFQYFVSTKLVLKDVRTTKDQNITKSGTAQITDVTYQSRIVIFKNTMGVVLNSFVDENDDLILEVCFEEDDNKRIMFRQDGPGSDKKFYILYHNSFNKTINYGGNLYAVDFFGDKPYLKIKQHRKSVQKTKTKWVRGRRVQN